jgi:hypothetical protein
MFIPVSRTILINHERRTGNRVTIAVQLTAKLGRVGCERSRSLRPGSTRCLFTVQRHRAGVGGVLAGTHTATRDTHGTEGRTRAHGSHRRTSQPSIHPSKPTNTQPARPADSATTETAADSKFSGTGKWASSKDLRFTLHRVQSLTRPAHARCAGTRRFLRRAHTRSVRFSVRHEQPSQPLSTQNPT